jgi:hypothetical protein
MDFRDKSLDFRDFLQPPGRLACLKSVLFVPFYGQPIVFTWF